MSLKKAVYFLFCVLLFAGCKKTENPSCAEQWEAFKACFISQFESYDCDGPLCGPEAEIVGYCKRDSLGPNFDFSKKCKETALKVGPLIQEMFKKKCGDRGMKTREREKEREKERAISRP